MAEISNGCSGGVSWFYKNILKRKPRFETCCDEHDLGYHENGWPWRKFTVDWRFYKCVKDTGRPVKSFMMFLAVSAFLGWVAWFRNTPRWVKEKGGYGKQR